jgi:hypothetical protein
MVNAPPSFEDIYVDQISSKNHVVSQQDLSTAASLHIWHRINLKSMRSLLLLQRRQKGYLMP